MARYTLEQLIGMNDEALGKAARQAFSMQFDPFSELGKRAMKRSLEGVMCVRKPRRISPALTMVIGVPALIIENILDYQDALSDTDIQSAS